MAFNISTFRNSFSSSGEPAAKNLYEFELFNLPSTIPISSYNNIKYRCEQTDLPGRMIGTTDLREYGPLRKIAYGSLYNDLQATFIVSESMLEKNVFLDWHNTIVNNTTDNDIEYYNNYIGSINITQYRRNGTPALKIRIDEAYPVNVAAMPLSWQDKNDYHRLSVDFAIRNWRKI